MLDVLPKPDTVRKRLQSHNRHMDNFRRWRLDMVLLPHLHPGHMFWRSGAGCSGRWKLYPKCLMPKHADDHDQNLKVPLRVPHSRSHLSLHAFSSFLHRPHWPLLQIRIREPLKLHWLRSRLHKTRDKRKEYECSQSLEKRVPKGSVAVYVGKEQERYVIPVIFLSHPVFEDLLKEAEKEFGFRQKAGLTIPCTVHDFQQKLCLLEREIERERAPHCISVGVAHNMQSRRKETRKYKSLEHRVR